MQEGEVSAIRMATRRQGAAGPGGVAGVRTPRRWRAALVLLVASSGAQAAAGADGSQFPQTLEALESPYPGCTCIDDVPAFLARAHPELFAEDAPSGVCAGWSDGRKCLPEGFGQGKCAAWDHAATMGSRNVTHHCVGQNNAPVPEWCTQEWCYVNSTDCLHRDHYKFTYVFKGRAAPQSSSLHYSYATCGFVDKYSLDEQVPLSGSRVIRVTAPAVATPTRHLKAGAESGFDWEGGLWELMEGMQHDQNVTLQQVQLTSSSLERNPFPGNSWWACLHALLLNTTDVCIGDFWVTDSRRAYMSPHGTFTTPFDSASFMFITEMELSSKGVEPSWGWSDPLRPFHYTLWVSIFFTSVFSAVAYNLAETIAAVRRARTASRKERGESHMDDELQSPVYQALLPLSLPTHNGEEAAAAPHGPTTRIATLAARARTGLGTLVYRGKREPKELGPDPGGSTVVESMFMNTLMLVGRTPHQPRSHGGRIVQITFALFTLITLQFWGSLITTGLVVQSGNTMVGTQSLKDAADNGEKVCFDGWLSESFINGEASPPPGSPKETWDRYKVAQVAVGPDGRGDLEDSIKGSMEAMDEGYCMHMVAELSMFETELKETAGVHCKKGAIGSNVLTDIQVAMAVRKEYEHFVSYYLTKNMGDYMQKKYLEHSIATPTCDPFLKNKMDLKVDSQALHPKYHVQNMTVEFTLVLVGAVLGVLVSLFAPCVPEAKQM